MRVVADPLVRGYREAWELQRHYHSLVAGGGEEVIILTVHPPVITIGRNGGWEHLKVSTEYLTRQNIEVVETDRGGDITYHGPGQLVVYPILHLKNRGGDLHRFLRDLEEAVIRTLEWYKIYAYRIVGRSGVWTDKGKVASLGVHMKKWVTYHGLAFNIEKRSQEGFRYIVPCGLTDARMTSLEELIGERITVEEVIPQVTKELTSIFEPSFPKDILPERGKFFVNFN